MRTIRIDDDVWKALMKRAKPLEDTPNSVLRRVLGLSSGGRSRTRTFVARDLSGLPQREFKRPLLEVLYGLGGSAHIKDAKREFFRQFKSLLQPVDLQPLVSGNQIRWENKLEWARFHLVEEGLMRRDSPKGIWELTDKGRKEAEKILSKGG